MKRVANGFWFGWALTVSVAAVSVLGSAHCSVKTDDTMPYDVYLILRFLDAPKYIFVTSATYNGDLKTAGNRTTGVAGADALCAADSRASGGIYKALIVDGTNRIACTSANCATNGSSEHVDWVLRANQEYRRSASTTIIGTSNSIGLFAFPLTNTFHTSGQWWTGLVSNWTSKLQNLECSDWSDSAGLPTGSAGSPQSDARAIETTTIGFPPICSDTASLVCVQQ